MAVTGPDFISLQVRDLERSAAFYEQYLGLKRSDAGPPHAVVFGTKPIAFAVRNAVAGADLDAITQPGQGMALWLHAPDAQDIHDALAAAGTTIISAPADGPFKSASAGVTMNYARIALASFGAMVAYFIYGFAMFAAWPSMKTEFMKYPNVYRPKDEMMKVMPYGMIAIFIAIVIDLGPSFTQKSLLQVAASYPAYTSALSLAFSLSAPSQSTTTST